MKNLSVSIVITVIIQIVNILTGILAARLLLPEGRGELAVIMLWPAIIFSLGAIGLPDSIAYHVAQRKSPHKIYGTALWVSAALSLLLGVFGFILIPLVLKKYDRGIIALALWFLFLIPLNFWTLLNGSIFLGQRLLHRYNILRVSVHVGYLAGIGVLYALHRATLAGFVIAYLGSIVLNLTIGSIWLLQRHWLDLSFDYAVAKELISFGLKSHMGSMASFFNLRLDQMVMSIFLAPTAMGLYVVAVSIAGGASLVASTISFVTFSYVANAQGASKSETFGRLVRLGICASVLSAIVLLIMTPAILNTFFGPAFAAATLTTRILTIAGIFLGVNTILSAGLKAMGDPLLSSKAEFISLSITVLSLSLLLPRYQIVGAAWASLLAYGSTLLFIAVCLNKYLKIHYRTFFLPTRNDWSYGVDQLKLLTTRSRSEEPMAGR